MVPTLLCLHIGRLAVLGDLHLWVHLLHAMVGVELLFAILYATLHSSSLHHLETGQENEDGQTRRSRPGLGKTKR